MPEKDGIEVMSDLCRDKPDLPIIAMTAISGGGRMPASIYLDVAWKFGAPTVLQNPFDQALRLVELERALQKKQPALILDSRIVDSTIDATAAPIKMKG